MTAKLFIALLALAPPASAPTLNEDESCPAQLVVSRRGENHVFFHGISPDGRTLAVGWDRGSGANVERGAYLLDLRTRQRTDLPHLNNAASFSPDGRYLVAANYSADPALHTEIVEFDRRTGQARTYASGPSAEWLPSYSKDGHWILFNSTRSGSSDLYRVNRSSGTLEQLTHDPIYEAHSQSVDRDRRVLFHRQVRGDDYDVAIIDVQTGRSQAIGATPLEEAYPALSPDGRWVAFSAVANAGERPNIYVMPARGSQRRRLTNGTAKDAYAGWAPDGRFLYFVRFREEGAGIYRIRMDGGRCLVP